MKSQFRFASAHLVATILMLGGCAPRDPDPGETQVNTRIKSPDGKLEAIYAEDIGGGPAVGVTEEVFVVKPGAFPHTKERVFSEECAHNTALTWEGPRTLWVRYEMGSDIRENPNPNKPSIFSIFSSAYWTFGDPHGVQVRFTRRLTPPNGGC